MPTMFPKRRMYISKQIPFAFIKEYIPFKQEWKTVDILSLETDIVWC